MGKLLAICTSPKRGTVKTEVPSAVLTPEWGKLRRKAKELGDAVTAKTEPTL